VDIISHGLWGSIAFGRKNRRSFWKAFLFGIAPDALSFGPFFVLMVLGFLPRPDFSVEPPPMDAIPQYVHIAYNVTHSILVFVLLFGLLWLLFRRPVWESFAWPLHILVDIPTHSSAFFPTPFLWPLSSFMVDGKNWGSPEIFIPNVILLIILYAWFFIQKQRYKNKITT